MVKGVLENFPIVSIVIETGFFNHKEDSDLLDLFGDLGSDNGVHDVVEGSSSVIVSRAVEVEFSITFPEVGNESGGALSIAYSSHSGFRIDQFNVVSVTGYSESSFSFCKEIDQTAFSTA
mgnify:CR=1 FL=1